MRSSGRSFRFFRIVRFFGIGYFLVVVAVLSFGFSRTERGKVGFGFRGVCGGVCEGIR